MALRDRWNNRFAFVMAAVGSAVGLGNVWRFPFVCYDSGGGAFLIPFFVALFTAGIPLMILEYALGQRMQGSAPHALFKVSQIRKAERRAKDPKKSSPNWEWVGWWALLVGSTISFYYAVIMSWAFNYLYHSLKVSWAGNESGFFYQTFLRLSEGPGVLGGVSLPIVIGLAITWILIYFIISKGVGRVGKVVMITVPLPVLLMVILVIRGVTLPGAIEGLSYYLTPDFSKLLDPKVWLAAYSQVFFSLSLGFGILIAYASYMPKDSEITNNAFLTSLADAGISFLGGFAVFSTLGYLTQATGSPITEVAKGGPGLAFVIYPTVISKLPWLQGFFGVVFFLMLLTLGIDSAFSIVEGVCTGIQDKWGLHRHKSKVAFVFCLVGFIIGLLFCTKGGLYWLDIADHWVNNFGLAVVGLFECIIIGYFFNIGAFRKEINSVSEIQLGKWWEITIKYFTPLVLVIFLIWNIVTEIRTAYEGYPLWALILGGWAVSIGAIVGGIILMKIRTKHREEFNV
ncbi:sodium-dependent transporter [bacterium]|nr:sodium-dependent transporter [bacterium]